MKLKYIIFVFLMGIAVIMVGCDYGPVFILPDGIKKINIPAMSNKTIYYGIEEKLTNLVIEEFLQDGKLKITGREEADACLEGEIVSYVLRPMSFDEGNKVEEYELEIQVSFVLKDLATAQDLWTKTFRQFTRYFPLAIEEEQEEEAKETVLKYLAGDIVRKITGGRKK